MKTAELNGAALDWVVAKCEGFEASWHDTPSEHCLAYWKPSTAWAQGGPIIEREEICFMPILEDDNSTSWAADKRIDNLFDQNFTGQTPLIAAMRCYVASKLGDEVDIPPGIV